MNFKTKQMNNETSMRLIEKYQLDGDIESRNEVILGNIRLVYAIAHRYRRSLKSAFDDFVSEGIIGMIESINKFDTKNYKNFSTYAYWHILKKVNSSINMGTLNLPQHRINIYTAYEKEKTKMLSRGESPSLDIIAQNLNISDNLLIDTINKKDDINLSLVDSVRFSDVSSSKNFEDQLLTMLDFEKTKKIIESVLSEQEQSILKYRFGLNGEEPLTLQETSQHLNISSEYVRILQNKSLAKLKKSLTRKW